MKPQRRRQVAVGEPVAGEHHGGFVQHMRRLAHAARRAQRGLFRKIGEVYAVFRPVSKIAAHLAGQVHQRHRRLGYPMPPEQIQGIGHHRPVQHRYHGFGTGAGQGAQPGALAPRHDHSLHGSTPSGPSTPRFSLFFPGHARFIHGYMRVGLNYARKKRPPFLRPWPHWPPQPSRRRSFRPTPMWRAWAGEGPRPLRQAPASGA